MEGFSQGWSRGVKNAVGEAADEICVGDRGNWKWRGSVTAFERWSRGVKMPLEKL